MTEAGLIVISAFISPYKRDRLAARKLFAAGILSSFVDAPLEVCEARDPKGLSRGPGGVKSAISPALIPSTRRRSRRSFVSIPAGFPSPGPTEAILSAIAATDQ